jgi:hypothetical protein
LGQEAGRKCPVSFKMVKQDFIHLAEVAMSIRSQFKPDDEAFDQVLHRFEWAIIASPEGAKDFDGDDFRDMAYGRKSFE